MKSYKLMTFPFLFLISFICLSTPSGFAQLSTDEEAETFQEDYSLPEDDFPEESEEQSTPPPAAVQPRRISSTGTTAPAVTSYGETANAEVSSSDEIEAPAPPAVSPEELRRREEEARRREEEARKRAADEALAKMIREAESFEKQGDYLKAREAYEKMLNQGGLSKARLQEIADKFANANFQLLLSPQEMPESTTHVVKRGDSLYVIAKKYGTTVDLIRKSNNIKGDLIYPDQKLKVITGPFTIRVDKSDNELFLYLGEKPVKRYQVATGEANGTPVGDFKVVTKLENPVWYNAGAVVPADSPENILGSRWLGFDKAGYGIHGTTKPESIGKQETSGCVRMLNEEVEELYSVVPYGAKVTVVD